MGKTGGCLYGIINTTMHLDRDYFINNRAAIDSIGIIFLSTGSLILKNSIIANLDLQFLSF